MLVRSSSCLALLCSALCTLGCADDPEPDEPCNELVNDGPEVTPELLTAGTTPMGGTIIDGQYEQTGFDYYPDPGVTLPPEPRTFSGVFEFASGALEAVTGATFVEDAETGRFSASYAASGTELTLTYSCPRNDVVEQPQFSATDSEVRLFYRVADDMATVELILTKR